MDRAEVVNALHTNDSSGLTAQAAAERLKIYGPNKLKE